MRLRENKRICEITGLSPKLTSHSPLCESEDEGKTTKDEIKQTKYAQGWNDTYLEPELEVWDGRLGGKRCRVPLNLFVAFLRRPTILFNKNK